MTTSSHGNYSFYDNLRTSPTASFRPVREEPEPSVGRALHIATDPEQLGENSVTLCHVPIFMRYSIFNSQLKEFQDVSSDSYGGTAAALLAMHHFNNGDGSIVEELEGINRRCNIRFTTEVVDTESSPIVAVQNLAAGITRREETDIQNPQACAVMGAAWYDVSQSMATVTGVYDILQVSPSSSSMTLDKIQQFPLFSRTHPSDEAKGLLAVDYFDKVLGTKHFGILFANSEQGLALHERVVDTAMKHNMTTRSVAFPEEYDASSLRNALKQLKESGFNFFLGILYPAPYDEVMEVAVDVDVAGPGKFWLVTGHLADSFAIGNTTIKTGSNAAIGSTGMAVLHDDGGPGLTQFDKFSTQWKKLQYNQEALNYINSKQPGPPEGTNMSFGRSGSYFALRPSHYTQFSYDAIAGMGMAACRAADQSTLPDNYFSGTTHHETFLKHSFTGATGNVTFDHDTFSREGYSLYYFVSEIHEIDRPALNTSIFSGPTRVYFDTESRNWKPWPGAPKFVYSDGTTIPPADLPPYSENTNSLTTLVQVTCLVLGALVMLTSIGLSVYVFVKRKNVVITASQPPFLYMLCIGTLVMSSAIIPLTIDDSVTNDAGCSVACMSRVWLLSIGFTITFSALFSKTRRINKLVNLSRGFVRVKVSASDVMVPFLAMLFTNVLILSLWTALAPLQWERTVLQYDQFGRPVESVGACYSENWLPYGISLCVVNGTALLLAVVEAYKARRITTEFSESKYIGMAVVCIFQAMFFGIPLILLTEQWPTPQTFVSTAMIFIICMAVLLLIFVPKILLIKSERTGSFATRSSMSRGSIINVDNGDATPNGTPVRRNSTPVRRNSQVRWAPGTPISESHPSSTPSEEELNETLSQIQALEQALTRSFSDTQDDFCPQIQALDRENEATSRSFHDTQGDGRPPIQALDQVNEAPTTPVPESHPSSSPSETRQQENEDISRSFSDTQGDGPQQIQELEQENEAISRSFSDTQGDGRPQIQALEQEFEAMISRSKSDKQGDGDADAIADAV